MYFTIVLKLKILNVQNIRGKNYNNPAVISNGLSYILSCTVQEAQPGYPCTDGTGVLVATVRIPLIK